MFAREFPPYSLPLPKGGGWVVGTGLPPRSRLQAPRGTMAELERKQDRAPVPAGWDYAPAPEARDLVQVRERYGHFVGGGWLEPAETYTTIDPATEDELAEVGQATPPEVTAA